MGLYLCVFDGDEELDGVEVGSYADFECFRAAVTEHIERGIAGVRCPTLIIHSDADGQWSPTECAALRRELAGIAEAFRRLPARSPAIDWQRQVAKLLGLNPATLYDSFIDVDGEPLVERLERLCDLALRSEQPILFQ